MNHELQKEILVWLLHNRNIFGLRNAASEEFKAYLYDDKGEYLIGGLEISQFIDDAVSLLEKH